MNDLIKKIKNKGFFHIFNASFLNKIIQFCSGIFLVRVLTKEDFGVYSYAQNILNMVLLVSGLGTIYALMQFGSESTDDSKRNVYFRYGLKIGFIFNFLLMIGIILFSNFFPFEIERAQHIVLLMCFMPICMYAFELIQTYFRTGLYNVEFSKLSTTNTFFIFVFSILGAIVYGIQGVVVSTYIAYTLSIVLGIFLIKKKNIWSSVSKLNKGEKVDFLKYSSVSMLNNAISQLVYLADLFIIGILIKDVNIIASYKAATILPFALNFIPISLMTFVYPYFAKNKDDKIWIKEKLLLMQKFLIIFNLLLSIFLIISAPLVIKIIFGEQYLDSVNIFRVLCISYFIASSFRIPAGNILVMMRKVNYIFYVNLVTGILNIGLDIILINQFSIWGAVTTTIIIIMTTSILYNIYLYRILK
ncbi:oligosaccharide flippase family protein [Bacillus paranthracis]|uniref:oligosaccharide flippase family protein n=1 Tax=Bacillus cereus group TaxID=86661 RepID=UPI00093792A5